MPGGGDGADNITVRGLNKYQRSIKSLGNEIIAIRNKGFASITSLSDRNVFRGMFDIIDKRFQLFENSWDSAFDYAEEHELEFPTDTELAYLETVRQSYYDARGYGVQLFSSGISVNNSTHQNTSSCSHESSRPRSILPKISIKSFKGDMSLWPTFKQMYDALIRQDPNLSDAERFHYLISFLEGPALDTIKHIPVMDSNYNQAWDALCKVYDNKRKLACNYINKLLSFQPSTKTDSSSLQAYLSNVTETVTSLQNLNIPEFEEYLLCEIALRGLDFRSRTAFELSITSTTFPTFTSLRTFIQDRCHALRMTEDAIKSHQKPQSSSSLSHQAASIKRFAPNNFSPKPSGHSLLTTDSPSLSSSDRNHQSTFACFICRKPHTLTQCHLFKQGSPSQRLDLLKKFPGCRNCLNINHKARDCNSSFTCRECKGKHHSLLHLPSKPSVNTSTSSVCKGSQEQSSLESSSSTPSSSFVGANTSASQRGVLLGTVTARILDSKGNPHVFRGVLDNGSQWSFITQECVKRLGKSTRPFSGAICGVNSVHIKNIIGKVSLSFLSTSSKDILETDAIVMPNITPPLPLESLDATMWQDYLSYNLSDPDFTNSLPISFLIGADLFTEVITGSPIVLYEHGPRLVDTIFGYTVMGKFSSDSSSDFGAVSLLSISDTARLIERFWMVEEPVIESIMSPEDKACEEHFVCNHSRDPSGRYIVSLPIKSPSIPIKPNIAKAISRFYALESKFSKDKQLLQDYSQFMQEYLDLGHMSLASSSPSYVIPHHPVFKVDAIGNRQIRVVFDASFRTSSGSLNDHLYAGPKLQADISSIVLNFRQHKFVISCDIVKMFRQILVSPEDRKFQQIVWRFEPSEPLQYYELNTVTYGLRSSPFQAQRVLRQLALDEGHAFPAAAAVLLENTYVDDCVFGSDSIEDISTLKADLILLLSKGGFTLSKWKTNYPPLIANECESDQLLPFGTEEGSLTKILGMSWDPTRDALCYEISEPSNICTKRIILSCIARLYDPLGYLAPVIFLAKFILQETWKAGLNWDDPVPEHIKALWMKLINDFPAICKISIPRAYVHSTTYEMICFCDASERGYCAVAYLRSTHMEHSTMALLKAKTRLAPLKSLTIPRLELSAALLLAQLIKSLTPILSRYNITRTLCFSDSTIALAWLKTPPHLLMTFVANRVKQVMEVTQLSWWHHIRGVENPADIGSRGALPSNLLDNQLWWHGPAWCSKPITDWPLSTDTEVTDIPELKPVTPVVLANILQPGIMLIVERFSSFPRLIRVLAFVRRFIHNARIPKRKRRKRIRGPVSALEFSRAEQHCIRLVQLQYYPEIFKRDSDNLPSDLKMLSVFIDAAGLIRVGGRLVNAPLSLEHKFPILLPARSHLTNIIVDHIHKLNNHPGPTALLAFLRQRYWIPRARNLIRFHKSKCVTCIRYSNATLTPYMGNLPASRFNNVRPFINCGVDFAGPFLCRQSTNRKSTSAKSYLCLFTCYASRAVHLEIATSLTVESFLDAFDRFTARRGLPSHVYSDCGTNFIGACNYLQEVYGWFNQPTNQDSITSHTAHLGVQWSFNPPNSPHMGGLWESLIKTTKSILYKEFGNQPFTQSELSTMFTKVEGIINSRPLQPLSDSPEDNEVLTPGHFLIGQPINCIPEPDLMEVPINHLNRWQLLRARVQHFWSRWKNEYLASLQVRSKWLKRSPNLRVGDIVILKDTKTSPTYWPLARVVDAHPGSDDVVRVVTLRTSRGTYKRSIVNVIPLPIDHDL